MISITRLRAALKFPADRDSELELLRDAVISIFEARTHRNWMRRTGYIETRRTLGDTYSLYLGELRPVESVKTVEERLKNDGTWVTLDPASYLLELGLIARIEKIGAPFATNVRVTFDGGYTHDTTILTAYITPSDIANALEIQARFIVNRMNDEKIATRSQSFDGVVAALEEADLHPLFNSTVAKYARRF